MRERVKYGWGTIPSLKKVPKKIRVRRVLKKSAARQKNTGSAGPAQNREKKTGERTGQIRVGYHTVLKKMLHAKKNTGSAGPAQNREKKKGERTGQIRGRYHTVLKKSAARQKKYGFGGSTTEP